MTATTTPKHQTGRQSVVMTPSNNVTSPIDLDAIAERIRARIARTMLDIIATGNDLIMAKEKLKHGAFTTWVVDEFGMTDRTARNYMRTATWAADKSETVSVLPLTTVYALAAPSTPEAITTEVISDLEAGRPVDHHAIESRIRKERQERRRQRLNLQDDVAADQKKHGVSTRRSKKKRIERFRTGVWTIGMWLQFLDNMDLPCLDDPEVAQEAVDDLKTARQQLSKLIRRVQDINHLGSTS